MHKPRAVAVVRLSVDTINSTSPARQREIIEHAAAARGSTIIGWAEDLDVSATKVPPWRRPQLSAWLDRPGEFDELLFWRLDRFVRSPGDFARMIEWCSEHGKNLASATESFDLSSPMGEAMAYMTAVFAKMESAATKERVLGAHQYLRQAGRFGGGKPPYGCLAVPVEGGKGWTLVQDPDTAPLVREAVQRVLAGEAVNSVVADFNRRGIPAPVDGRSKDPKGLPWRTASMRRMLRSPALLGHAVHQGQTVTGDDGLPVRRGVALITQSEFDRLQRAMAENSYGPLSRSQTPSLLLGVAYCALCSPWPGPVGTRLYRGTRSNWNRPRVPVYTCARAARPAEHADRCKAPAMVAEQLEDMAGKAFLHLCGHLEEQERVWIPGEDHSEEQAQVRAALANVRAEYDRGGYAYNGGQSDYDERVSRLANRLRELDELPSRPAGYVIQGTGRTIADVWEAGSVSERRRLMVSSGYRLYCWKDKLGHLRYWHASTGLDEKVQEAATRDIRPAKNLAGCKIEGVVSELAGKV